MPLTAEQILQAEYLQARAKILELAATLDRLHRADGSVEEHAQMKLLQQGFSILLSDNANKAAEVQLLFSRQYDPNWRATMNV